MSYLLEFMGIVLICMTSLLTHHNPIFVSLALLSALYIGHGKVDSYFSPLIVVAQYGLGRMSLIDSLKHLAVQMCAVLLTIFAYKF